LFLVEPESWSATQGPSSIGFDGDRTPGESGEGFMQR
jgi:hypothetical protein